MKVRLIKICKIEPPDVLFLVVFINFYISRYHFSQIFRSSFDIICKKDFRHKFSFLLDSLNPPSPPRPERPNSAKRDEIFLSMLPSYVCEVLRHPWSVVLGIFWPRRPKITFFRSFTSRFVLELLLVLHPKAIYSGKLYTLQHVSLRGN